MGKCLFMRKGETHTTPEPPFTLSKIAEGSIVKINENGVATEYYVAKHDYESGLNGTGRTLLVRKAYYPTTVKWDTRGTANELSTSNLDTWLNGTFKSLLDEFVQEEIGTTKFYYTPTGSASKSTLSRGVFIPSVTEYGASSNYALAEGSALPIASSIRAASVIQWTRTAVKGATNTAISLDTSGATSNENTATARYVRPCFTLPSTALFDEETLEFKGVA